MSTQLTSSFYRTAGISYLRYLNLSTTYARKAVKASVRPTYGAREQLFYGYTKFENGVAHKKKVIDEPKLE